MILVSPINYMLTFLLFAQKVDFQKKNQKKRIFYALPEKTHDAFLNNYGGLRVESDTSAIFSESVPFFPLTLSWVKNDQLSSCLNFLKEFEEKLKPHA